MKNLSPPPIVVNGVEPFGIPAEDWNALVAYLYTTRPLTVGPTEDGPDFNHPWKCNLSYDFESSKWLIQTNPGFVRGHQVQVSTVEQFVERFTFDRLSFPENYEPKKDKRIDAFLTERPKLRIDHDRWNVVAAPGKISIESGEQRNKAVPEILVKLYNVKLDSILRVDLENQSISLDSSDELKQDPNLVTQLRSIEVVLEQPRPKIEIVETDDLYLGFPIFEQRVRYANPTNDPPRLRLYTTLPTELVAGSQNVLQAMTEAQRDYQSLHIATVWMVGPPGDMETETPDSTWLPLVQHHVYWNLDFTVNAQISEMPPLRFVNPAAGLMSGSAVQPIIDSLNAANAQVEAMMNTTKIEGSFWTI